MARRSSDKRRPRPATKRQFPRTARLNTLLQQIVAQYLERVDDERLGFLTVTGVEVDNDLNRAVVASSYLRERELVLKRLRQQGLLTIDARPEQVGPELINRYLHVKRRELI